MPSVSKGRLTPPRDDAIEQEIEARDDLNAQRVACEPDDPAMLTQLGPRPAAARSARRVELFQKPIVAIVGARNVRRRPEARG